MNNIVATSCDKCTFMKNGCKLGKPTFNDNEKQYSEGLCRFKRFDSWCEANKDYKLSFKAELIADEEARFSVVVPCLKAKTKDILKTIDSIVSSANGCIKEMILVIFDNPKESTKQIVDYIKKKDPSGISWKIEIYKTKEDENIDLWFAVDYAIELVSKTNWFFTMIPGDTISQKTVEFIRSMLRFKSNNLVCLYFDLDDSIRLIIHKNTFVEMRGNLEMNWFEKIKTFDNWDKICLRID